MTFLTSDNLLWLLVGLAAALLLFYSYVLRSETLRDRRMRPYQFVLLWILRLSAAAIALVVLARPASDLTRTETRLPIRRRFDRRIDSA